MIPVKQSVSHDYRRVIFLKWFFLNTGEINERKTYSGIKLTISFATFSQLSFEGQKTRHESFGITSETEQKVQLNLQKSISSYVYLPKPTSWSGSFNRCCFVYLISKYISFCF